MWMFFLAFSGQGRLTCCASVTQCRWRSVYTIVPTQTSLQYKHSSSEQHSELAGRNTKDASQMPPYSLFSALVLTRTLAKSSAIYRE